MKTIQIGWDRSSGKEPTPAQRPGRLAAANALHLVNPHEMETLRTALTEGRLPLDFQAKLEHLARKGLLYHDIEQNSLRFISLLLAAEAGEFHGATPADRERLLRVLAYVRKDDDAIPDYRPGGFVDDHREVRTATLELASVLEEFKRWRLRYQVPRMWLAGPEPNWHPPLS